MYTLEGKYKSKERITVTLKKTRSELGVSGESKPSYGDARHSNHVPGSMKPHEQCTRPAMDDET